jgi:ferric-dicitrate binding protein FerR (iron transport regulator)
MKNREDERPADDDQRARHALHDAPPPRSDDDFRARVKKDFVSGAIEVTGTREARGRARRKSLRLPSYGPRVRAGTWVAAGAAAAAAIVLVVGTLNQGPDWWVTGVRGEGMMTVDGQPVALTDRDAMRRLLVPGAEIALPKGAELDLCSDGTVALQLSTGASITLPPPPARWIGRDMELHARAGEIRFTTGPRFPGVDLWVHTPIAAIEVTGTTLAVIVQGNGTCVCVLEGTAKVGKLADGLPTDMQPVTGGNLRFIYKGDRPSAMDEMRPWERTRLADFRQSQRPWLQGAAAQ